jgi:tripartite-type tricarboxylate transporter receptor subunit TctC
MKKARIGTMLAAAVLAVTVISGCGASSSNGSQSGTAAPKADPKYPTKPIQLIVPFGAGGGTDLVSRAVAEYLTKEWGQTVNVVNKPGAGGATGTQEVLKGTADGYTVLAHNGSSTEALLAGNSNLPFKIEDFKFVSTVVDQPFAYIVKGDSPFNSMKDFDDWVKQNPDKLTFGSTGVTSVQTFSVIQWLDSIGVDYSKVHLVPNNGAGELLPQIAGGHVMLAVQDVTGAANLVKAGKLKILGVTSQNRSPLFPDVPTLDEQGVKNVNTHFWSGISVPSGTPDYIVTKWQSTIDKMLKDSAFLDKLKTLNAQGKYLNSTDFAAMVKSDMATYVNIVKQKGLVK